jgi:hypothetical protein
MNGILAPVESLSRGYRLKRLSLSWTALGSAVTKFAKSQNAAPESLLEPHVR